MGAGPAAQLLPALIVLPAILTLLLPKQHEPQGL
jgi:hypothetical protein